MAKVKVMLDAARVSELGNDLADPLVPLRLHDCRANYCAFINFTVFLNM